jgi:diguanylate cyclase (GGDEF)-like protein
VIGQLASDSGFALVVPAYFLCAGILLYTAIVAAILGAYRGRAPLNLSFAATCVFSAMLAFAQASYYLAASVHGGVEAMRWANAAGICFLFSVFVFAGLYTEARNMGRFYGFGAALGLFLVAATFLLPYGTRYSSIESYSWLQLPWGESLFQLHGTISAWTVAMRVLSLLVVAWAVWRLLELNRHGRRRDALVLAIYFMVLFAASVQGALIDRGWVAGFYLTPIAQVGLALLMSINLGMRMREQNSVLRAAARELQAENERRREAEARIRERAFTDMLTGLPNRAFVQDRLANQVELGAEGAHGAVLLCDLDHFKVINDALSHELGDELLRRVAARLSAAASGVASVARMDGNAFMLALESLEPDERRARSRIAELAGTVARALAQPIELGEHAIEVSASMGLATFAARASTANEVIGHADLALQRAKKRGRSTVQPYEPSFRQQAAERFRIIDGLRRAIGTTELQLHFQPQVGSAGRVIGAEALMRWTSPTLGAVSPSVFIPVAEESGLIHALGEWSLRSGCESLARWKRAGRLLDGHLSINVSPWQLARPEFVDRLCDIVEASEE